MLKNITINYFRGIKHCEIENLGLVNIFLGPNNSCKTTILDSLYLGFKEPFGHSLHANIQRRVDRNVGGSEIWYDAQTNKDISISLDFEDTDETRNVYTLSLLKDRNSIVVKHSSVLQNQRLSHGYAFQTLNPIPLGGKLVNIKEYIQKYFMDSTFIYSVMSKNDISSYLDKSFGKIKINPSLEEDVFDKMNDIYGDDFKFEYIPRIDSPNEKKLSAKDQNFRVLLDFCGDGVQRGLLILSELSQLKNTSIIIEELETAQHPKALMKLINYMVDLAIQNNIQLFITTHNPRVYSLMNTKFNDLGCRSEFEAFELNRNDGVITTTPLLEANLPESM